MNALRPRSYPNMSRPSGITLLAMLSFLAVLAVLYYLLDRFVLTPAPPTKPVPLHADMVRGHLAANVWRGRQVDAATTNAGDMELVYLPQVKVYAQNVQTGDQSNVVTTDLSGRFTLSVPAVGQYQVCWSSPLYGEACAKNPFDAGSEPLYLGTVALTVPRKEGFAGSYGKVALADGSSARTLEPFADVNAFPTVTLTDDAGTEIGTVAVNNFGEYYFPHVSTTQPFTLTASLESEKIEEQILPDIFDQNQPAIQYHLNFTNHPPRLDGIQPVDSGGNRVQLAAPGDTVTLNAETRDADGHPVTVDWLISPGQGTLSTASGNSVDWTLPNVKGSYRATAIAADGHGGYDRIAVDLAAGSSGVTFSGLVAGTDAPALTGAQVSVNGQLASTDSRGRFITYVPAAERYVFNITYPGYGFYSKIYDRSVAGGRWSLTRASVAVFNPATDIVFTDERDERNCPGPLSARIPWQKFPELRKVWWQDGRGNYVPPPVPSTNKKEKRQTALFPWDKRTDQYGRCGPGIRVEIPANGLETASGLAPTGQVEVSLSTVDLNTPEQMPGDESVRPMAGGEAWMQSFGAGSVTLKDTGSGAPLQLKAGMTADISIPVDLTQLTAGTPLTPTIPLLYYDETNGIWLEEGRLDLDGTGQAYVAKVSHFSTINSDVLKQDPSCIRVESSITPPYVLEVTVPMEGAAPRLRVATITDAPPHVIYNLPNNTNITLVAMTPGSAGVPPQPLGVFVVDSGPKHAEGFSTPPPASACASEVLLEQQTFPTVPVDGEFLHGLFSFAATSINEADLPTPGSLAAQLDTATNNYYAEIDPDGDRATFTDFRNTNGFTEASTFHLCGGVVCDDPDSEINAVFANSGDLGFGRDMHCRRTLVSGTYDYACYVSNYGDITTDDQADVENAKINNGLIATVAMEYSRILDTDAITERHVKFYVYGADGSRINRADLDNLGSRPVPQLCMVCHGGAYPGGGTAGVPVFDTPESVKLGSRFLPFDLRFLTFPATPDKTAHQSAIKRLNEDIVANASNAAVEEVIDEMYLGGVADQREEFVIPGWAQSQLPGTVAQEEFYKRVVGNACRNCHIAQPFANASAERAGMDLQFRTAQDYLRSQSITAGGAFSAFSLAEDRVCVDHVMPHATRTHDIFWGQYWLDTFGTVNPSIVAQYQVFGDAMSTLPRPAAWPAAESWPPVWSGTKCGQYTSAGTTPPSYYSTFVHPLWGRDYDSGADSRRCRTCHSSLSGDATQTHTELLDGDGLNGGALVDIVANNVGSSNVVSRVTGSAGARMPQGCPGGSLRCLNEAGGAYDPAADPDADATAQEIDRIKYWVNQGAPP